MTTDPDSRQGSVPLSAVPGVPENLVDVGA